VSDRLEKTKLTQHVDLRNENLIYLALGRKKLDLPPQDLIYSLGLIDYLSDELVLRLMDWIYDELKPGGRVILGNVHTSNPSRGMMDYLLDWRLIHRDEADLNRLYSQSRFGRPCTRLLFEEVGISLFAECVKNG
jgi:cyclopropane fatty-acyl-phospholipid synthase-like methyltransferase